MEQRERWTTRKDPSGERVIRWPDENNPNQITWDEFDPTTTFRELWDALCDQIDESNQPAPEPLPTMTGRDVANSLHMGATVEILVTPVSPCWGDPPAWTRAGGADWWLDEVGHYTFVARVVDPPKPKTERVPLWDAVGRKLPDGRTIARVTRDAGFVHGAYSVHPVEAHPLWVDTRDGMVEVEVLDTGGKEK